MLGLLCGVFRLSVITEIIKQVQQPEFILFPLRKSPWRVVCHHPQHYPEEMPGGQLGQGLAPVALAACRREVWDPHMVQLCFKGVFPLIVMEVCP